MREKVVAILGSDLHLTSKTPVARAEKNWFAVQEQYLRQVNCLCCQYNVPFIVAGDIFDKPNPGPEVINFAIDNLPDLVYAIPGQHDLLYHNYDDLYKTAYGTLIKAKAINNLIPGTLIRISRAVVSPSPWFAMGSPWNFKINNPGYDPVNRLLLVAHSYVWTKDDSDYNNPPHSSRLDAYVQKLKGYQAAVFGDNHKGFVAQVKVGFNKAEACMVYNNGCFIRRRTTEKSYKPHVGILFRDGSIQRHYLDTSKDEWATSEQMMAKAEAEFDAAQFLKDLKKLQHSGLDFVSVLERVMEFQNSSESIRRIIHDAMEKK